MAIYDFIEICEDAEISEGVCDNCLKNRLVMSIRSLNKRKRIKICKTCINEIFEGYTKPEVDFID